MKRVIALCVLAAAAVFAGGCIKHQVEVAPIHATIDVNLKVDRQLDSFFDFEDNAEKKVEQPAPSGAGG